MTKSKYLFGLILFCHFQVLLSSEFSSQTETILEKGLNEVKTAMVDRSYKPKKKVDKRDLKALTDLKSSIFDDQFETFCRDTESQLCTCYYPDHSDVIQFELGTDQITKNNFSVNGTGPSNCDDLQSIGHHLIGFYIVRFNPKRIKVIYCEFDQIKTEKLGSNSANIPNILNQSDKYYKSSSKVIRFCGGVGTQMCTFYYSDQPDSSKLELKNNNRKNASFSHNAMKGPTSCDDLKYIGYKLKGFHLLRFHGVKIKIVYCDFDTSIEKENKKSNTQKNNTFSTNVRRFCDGVGSRPCSCYYSKQPGILQLELSSDQVTRNASHENGTGPASCKDLELIGYTVKGFYVVRSKNLRMKMVFCEFAKKATPENENQSKKSIAPVTSNVDISKSSTSNPTTDKVNIIWNNNFPKIEVLINKIDNKSQTGRPKPLDFNRKTPVENKDEKSYMLKNGHGKCMAATYSNPQTRAESEAFMKQLDCDPSDKGQFWKWKNHGRLCNELDTCLTIDLNYEEGYSHNIKHLHNVEGSRHQEWIPGSFDGQILSTISYYCLGVLYDWANNGARLAVRSCEKKEKGQIWSIYKK